MLKHSKTISFSGSSMIKTEGTEDIAVAMNAGISEDGTFNINKYVRNVPLYRANKEEVDADCTEFENYVNSFLEV